MKRTKKLLCAIATITILVTHSNPALAKFAGTLRNDAPWTLEIQSTSGTITATVTFVDSRGRQDLDLFTIQNGAGTTPYSGATIPRGTRRIIIELDYEAGGLVSIRAQQGTTIITADSCCESDSSRFVFDVV